MESLSARDLSAIRKDFGVSSIPIGLTPPQIRRRFGLGSWKIFVQNYPQDAYSLFMECGLADLGMALLQEYGERKNPPIVLADVRKGLGGLNEDRKIGNSDWVGSAEPDIRENEGLNWRRANQWDSWISVYERD